MLTAVSAMLARSIVILGGSVVNINVYHQSRRVEVQGAEFFFGQRPVIDEEVVVGCVRI